MSWQTDAKLGQPCGRLKLIVVKIRRSGGESSAEIYVGSAIKFSLERVRIANRGTELVLRVSEMERDACFACLTQFQRSIYWIQFLPQRLDPFSAYLYPEFSAYFLAE